MMRSIHGVALLAIAALAVGCGQTGDGPGVATANNTSGGLEAPAADPGARHQQYLACMRAEGIEVQEDPGGRGGPVLPAGVPAEKVNAALAVCRRYLPDGGEPTKLSAEDIQKMYQYSRCIREQGVPEYPDPDPVTGYPDLSSAGNLKDHPKLTAAMEACRNIMPQQTGQTPGMVIG